MNARRMWSSVIGSGLLLLLASRAHAIEILRWERIPLPIPLHVGQERVVFVDQNVRIGMPPDLVGRLRVQSAGGAIYLLANDEIPPTRLQMQNVANGEIILVDVVATAEKNAQPLEPAKIVESEQAVNAHYGESKGATVQAGNDSTAQDDDDAPPAVSETPIPVVLTRYASQMLYAPLRTVEPVAGISTVRVRANLNLVSLMPKLSLQAQVLGAWKLSDYVVTAVRLRNTSPRAISQAELDPRDLMGNFVAATFQHPWLGARGDATDTTTVYLVTQRSGLEGALLPTLGRVDPREGGQ